jgi:hypothetical protein
MQPKVLTIECMMLLMVGSISFLFGSSGPIGNTSGDPVDRPVAHWGFENGEGTHAIDSSGNGNNGTVDGPTWVESIQGSGLLFEKDGDRVMVNDSDTLDLKGALSIEIWFASYRFEGNGMTDGNILICKYTSAPVGQYAIATYKNGGIRFWLSGESDHTVLDVPSALTIDRWHYVACTWDTEILLMFVDGRLVGSEETPFHSLRSAEYGNDQLTIGHHSIPDKEWPFRGIMDDITISSECLNPNMISARWNAFVEDHPAYREPVRHNDSEPDSDGDGMEDEWEIYRFGTLDYGPHDDNDGDGYINLQEYYYGSDPTDPDDFGPDPKYDYYELFIPIIIANFLLIFLAIAIPIVLLWKRR